MNMQPLMIVVLLAAALLLALLLLPVSMGMPLIRRLRDRRSDTLERCDDLETQV